jgi:hypothetical protein
MYCQIKYTPVPKPWVYDEEKRQKALEMYVEGMSLRRIARHLGTHHRTISLWVKEKAANLPKALVPAEVKDAEMDELFTFIGEKKPIYIITIVDRAIHCFLGYKVVWERTQQAHRPYLLLFTNFNRRNPIFVINLFPFSRIVTSLNNTLIRLCNKINC